MFAVVSTLIHASLATATIPINGLISFWDFQEASGPFLAKQGVGQYVLEEASFVNRIWNHGGAVNRSHDTPPGQPFGPLSASIGHNQMLEVLDTAIAAPLLDIHGDDATMTMVGWMKPSQDLDNQTRRDFGHFAGIWSEAISVRTFVMFCPQNSRGRDIPGNHLDVEISRTGATMQPACRWSISYALGSAKIDSDSWHMLAMTFDGSFIRAFVNGTLDYRPPHRLNPAESPCNETWQNPASISTWTNRTEGQWGPGGAPASQNRTDFTVGGQRGVICPDGVTCPGGMGHSWSGLIGGLAVFNRSLSDEELHDMAVSTGMNPKL